MTVARNRTLQVGAAFALGLAYCTLAVLLPTHFPSKGLYSPLAYSALVLATLVWGKKGASLAAVLALVGVLPRLWQEGIPDPWGDAGRTVSFLVVALGLSVVRGQAAAAIAAQRESERKYRDIVEKSLAGILVYRSGKVVYTNSRLKELLGMSSEDVKDAVFWDFVWEEDKPKVRRHLSEREEQGVADHHYECRLVQADGRPMWTEIVSSSVAYEGHPAVMVSVYNITARKEIEEKRQELSHLAMRQEEQLVHSTRLAEMGEMAAGIAHELNQPLTGIKNYAKNATFMLEEGVGDLGEVKDNLQLIASQVDRASRIIGQMRELARRSERQLAPIDVNQKLRETVEFVTPQLRLSGVDVTFSPDENLPKVMGDGIRIEQVFLNLLTNARQAMEDSTQRRLTIATRKDPSEERPVVVEIADTGKGFPPETAAKLFTPFYTTKQARYGTGLGLSISLSIIKDHAGTIEAAGAEGQGATFTVRLPAVGDETETPPESTTAGELTEGT